MRCASLLKRVGSAVVAIAMLGVQVVPVQAGMIGTGQIIAAQQGKLDRERLSSFLGRADLQRQLSALGVDVQSAKERVASLTDAEVARINQRIDQLPAGGNILGVLLLIFIVFVITDAIGATDIFPFVHPVR